MYRDRISSSVKTHLSANILIWSFRSSFRRSSVLQNKVNRNLLRGRSCLINIKFNSMDVTTYTTQILSMGTKVLKLYIFVRFLSFVDTHVQDLEPSCYYKISLMYAYRNVLLLHSGPEWNQSAPKWDFANFWFWILFASLQNIKLWSICICNLFFWHKSEIWNFNFKVEIWSNFSSKVRLWKFSANSW